MMRRAVRRYLSSVARIVAVAACVAVAAVTAPAASLPTLPFNGVLETGWVLADLDGDHKLDLARSRSIVCGGDIVYRVDVNLGMGGQVGSFTFANPGGLEVELAAVDVDGDSDLDLIVSGRFLGQRVGVFINDGRGTFSKSLFNLYPEYLDKTSKLSERPDSATPAVNTKSPERSIGRLVRAGLAPPQFVAVGAAAIGPFGAVQALYAGPQHLRSPPTQSLF
jgi:hypothetical protein